MANGIASDRGTQLQVGPAAQFGDTPLSPGVADFMDGFQKGFITVDDINRRVGEQVVRPSEVNRATAQNEQATLDAETLRPMARELAGKKLASELDIADLVAEINRQKTELEKLSLPSAETVQAATGAQAKLATGAATKVTGTPTQQAEVINDEQKRAALEEYGQLFGEVPDLVDVPSDTTITPASFEDWARNDPEIKAHLKSVPDAPAIEGAFIERLKQQPEVMAEYEQYKKDTAARPMKVGPEDPRYFQAVRDKALVKRQKLGVEAAKLKALPGVLEASAKAAAERPAAVQKAVSTLTSELQSDDLLKKTRLQLAAVNDIRGITSKPNPTNQDDLGLVYAVVRALDPTSVVREGEVSLLRKGLGLPNQLVSEWNRIVGNSNALLTPEVRKNFRSLAETQAQSAKVNSKPSLMKFYERASSEGLPLKQVFTDTDFDVLLSPGGATPPAPAGAVGVVSQPSAPGTPVSGGSRKIQNGNIFERQPDGSFKFVGPAQ